MAWLIHFEAAILYITPIAGLVAIVVDFSWTNFLLFLILLILWKHANGAL